MVNLMIGESAGKLLSKVPLSNNTISRRIQHIAEDLNDQLIDKLKGKEFGLQLDEATYSNSDAQLICYVRFIVGNVIVEDLLFCKSIIASAKTQDLFEILDTFISENSLEWTKCVGICADGARSMSAGYVGLQALIRRIAPDALWSVGPLRYSQRSSRVKTSESYIEPGLRMCSECSELHKNSTAEGKVFQETM